MTFPLLTLARVDVDAHDLPDVIDGLWWELPTVLLYKASRILERHCTSAARIELGLQVEIPPPSSTRQVRPQPAPPAARAGVGATVGRCQDSARILVCV